MQTEADGSLYDPSGDDDPDTGAECSDTKPLVVALGAAVGLTFANCVNFNALKNARPQQMRFATFLLTAAAVLMSILATFYGILTGAIKDLDTALGGKFAASADFGATLEEKYNLTASTCTTKLACIEQVRNAIID